MRTKDRAKKIGLIIIFLGIVVLALSLVSGRSKTVNVVYLQNDGLVMGKDLATQDGLFKTMEMSEEEFEKFNGQLLTSKTQLKGKMTIYPIAVGTPITKSSLVDYNGGGVFVAKMPEGRTVHQMVGVKSGLPQLEDGDKINVVLIYKEKDEEGAEQPVIALYMEEIAVYKQTETDLYLDVTLEQDLALISAAQKGTFVIQVPGKSTIKTSDTKEDVDFKKKITVDDLLNSIQEGEYYSEKTFTEQVTNAAKEVETNPIENESKEENTISTSTAESGGVSKNGK